MSTLPSSGMRERDIALIGIARPLPHDTQRRTTVIGQAQHRARLPGGRVRYEPAGSARYGPDLAAGVGGVVDASASRACSCARIWSGV